MTGRTDVISETKRARNGQRRASGSAASGSSAPGSAAPRAAASGEARLRPTAGRGARPSAGTGQPTPARRPAGAATRPAANGTYRPAPAAPHGKPGARPVTSRPRPQPQRPQAPRPQPYRPAEPGRASRTRFIFLVVGLLGGGLLCLLLINTILAAGSFQISALQQSNVTLSQQAQDLHARIAAEESPFSIARQARKLGMVEPGLLHFLNISTGRMNSGPSRMPGVPTVPGYTP